MPLRLELIADKEKGPGYGRLIAHGLQARETPVRLSIERNQGPNRYLGDDGRWQGQEAWIDCGQPIAQGDTVAVPVGPNIVDPIAAALANSRFKVTIEQGGGRQDANLRILAHRELLGSGARRSGPVDPEPAVSEPEPEAPSEPEGNDEASDEAPDEAPDETIGEPPAESEVALAGRKDEGSSRSHGTMLLMGFVLLLLVAGAAAYVSGLLPFGKEDGVPDPTANVTKPTELEPRTAVREFLQSKPSSEAAYQEAGRWVERGENGLAMLVYRYAAKAGHAPSAFEVARLYDPETFEAVNSPMPEPDIETAAYWYRIPAEAGNVEAQRRLGALLAELQPDGVGNQEAVRWLRKAAEAGDDEAAEILTRLGAK